MSYNNNSTFPIFREPKLQSSDYVQIFYLLLLFCIGAPLNLAVLFKLFRQYLSTHSRIILLSLHLNLSDLLILFFYAFAKACWLITYQWIGGTVLCKTLKFVQSTGFTLSSNVIICIAMDRTLSLLNPLRIKTESIVRCRRLLIGAWFGAILCNLPQLYIWDVYHASPNWSQCTSIWTIWDRERLKQKFRNNVSAPEQDFDIVKFVETSYHAFHLVTVFWLPLGFVITCYAVIGQIVYRNLNNLERDCLLSKRMSRDSTSSYQSLISQNANNNNDVADNDRNKQRHSLDVKVGQRRKRRRSSACSATCESPAISPNALRRNVRSGRGGRIKRMKLKTLKITFGIVAIYVICWLPYNVAALMQWLNLSTFSIIAKHVYSLHGLIVANAVINPLIYSNLSIFQRRKSSTPNPKIVVQQCQ